MPSPPASCRAGCAARTTTRCARYANACGALVVSRHGCAPAMPTRVELDYFLAQRRTHSAARPGCDAHAPAPRDGAAHAAARGVRVRLRPPQPVLRARAARRAPTSRASAALKQLLRRGGGGDRGRARARRAASACSATIATARTRSTPPPAAAGGSAARSSCRARDPLAFDRGRSIGTTLITWPVGARRQVPRAVPPRRRRSTCGSSRKRSSRALYEAVQASGHELLLEIIPPERHAARRTTTVLRALKRLYNLGIHPEWWKLAPMSPRAVAGGRCADRRARSALPRRADARAQRAAGRRSPEGFRDARASPTLPGLRGGPHDLPGAVAANGSPGSDRRRDAEVRDVRAHLRDAGRRLARRARRRRRGGRASSPRAPHDGAGAGALPRRAARATTDGRRAALRAACSRSSATATSPASARRCTRSATRCRPIARTTSRRWRTPRSPTPRRSSAGA